MAWTQGPAQSKKAGWEALREQASETASLWPLFLFLP